MADKFSINVDVNIIFDGISKYFEKRGKKQEEERDAEVIQAQKMAIEACKTHGAYGTAKTIQKNLNIHLNAMKRAKKLNR